MPRLSPPAAPAGTRPPQWQLRYRMFRGVIASWDDLFQDAANFASDIGPERVVTISHSEDKNDGVVTVWYWVSNQDSPSPGPS